jgi:hypothetical protein
MITAFDPKQVVSFKELLMSQVVSQEALTGLPLGKGNPARRSFWR